MRERRKGNLGATRSGQNGRGLLSCSNAVSLHSADARHVPPVSVSYLRGLCLLQVYLCNWEGAKAAVKLIELQGKKEAGKQSSVDMFLQEAEVAAILRHPNIVQVFKVNLEHVPGSDTYQGAIVMEYCEMGSLADAIKKNMFTFEHSNSPVGLPSALFLSSSGLLMRFTV